MARSRKLKLRKSWRLQIWILTCQRKVSLLVVLKQGRHDHKGSLRRFVERIHGSRVLRAVAGRLAHLTVQDLKFALQVLRKTWQFKFRDVVTSLLFLKVHGVERLSIRLSICDKGRWLRQALLAFALDCGLWGHSGPVCLRHSEAERDTSLPATALFAQDDLQVRRLGDIHEVLRVAAPHGGANLATRRIYAPLVLELNLVSDGQLGELNLLRSENPKEERSLFFLLLSFKFSIRNNDVVHIFLLVLGVQPKSSGQLPLLSRETARCCFHYDVFTVSALDLPQTVTLRLHANHQEIDWDDGSLANIEIFLHQADDHLRALGN